MRKTYGILLLSILILLLSPPIFFKSYQTKWVKGVSNFVNLAPAKDKSFAELNLENQVLKSQVNYIQEWLGAQQKFEDFFSELKKLEKTEHLAVMSHDAQKKRIKILEDFLTYFGRYAVAKIIFKEPFSSSSFAWINLGENYNLKCGSTVIQKNSPVVFGDILVGIVDEVFPHFSKIRLITDPHLVVSVKALRGKEQLKSIQAKAEDLLDALELVQEIKYEKKEELISLLVNLNKDLQQDGHDRYYARGEISGAEYSPLLVFQNLLSGSGFMLHDQKTKQVQTVGIKGFHEIAIKKGDLLVSTGMDGIIPNGLKVGFVTEVFPSNLGKAAYSIKAKSACDQLSELEYVQILPAVVDKFSL
jgi:rod shape-determining protein MreC